MGLTPEQLSELERLEAQATPAPWGNGNNDSGIIMPDCCDKREPRTYATSWISQNDEFIVAIRNAAKELIGMARENVELREIGISRCHWACIKCGTKYSNDMGMDLHLKNRALEAKLAKAKEALNYCAIEPGFLQPQNNVQHAVAANALKELE